MKNNPHKIEILCSLVLGPILIAIESWRRWGDLLTYAYFDDVLFVILAFIPVKFLNAQKHLGQLLWLITSGFAFCLIYFSFFGALSQLDQADPSRLNMSVVILVKSVFYIIVLMMCFRAIKLAVKHRFERVR